MGEKGAAAGAGAGKPGGNNCFFAKEKGENSLSIKERWVIIKLDYDFFQDLVSRPMIPTALEGWESRKKSSGSFGLLSRNMPGSKSF
ncbi:MAG: hypothetical protein PHD67_04050 [Oscillospiraceae bacterium]|nr:hypothetical protein [Oscillospiraceae bacterium]